MQSFAPQLVRAHTSFLLICLPFSTLKGDLLCLDSTMGSILHSLSLIKGKMSYPLPHNSSLPFFLHQILPGSYAGPVIWLSQAKILLG